MGILKGTIITILSFILLISLFLMSISLTMSWSLEYDTIKPNLKVAVKDTLGQEINLTSYINQGMPIMQAHCENNSEFVFNQEGYTFVLQCEKIRQGPEAIIDHSLDSLIEEAYYQEYDCKFFECLKETDTSLVLVSEKAREYWKSNFYIFLFISLALSTLIFIISNNKATTFLITGGLLIISSLPLLKIKWFLLKLPIPKEFENIILAFFTKSTNVFWILTIIGLLLFLFGISLHFFGLGQKLANWFSKNKENVSKDEVKNIVKEEVEKKKKIRNQKI